MLEYLEKDKEQLRESLRQAQGAEKAAAVLSKELERLLYEHNETCELPAEREAAAYMIQTLQMAVPFVDTVGETRVWERSAGAAAENPRARRHLLLLAGGAGCLIAALVLGLVQQRGISLLFGGPVILLLLAAGLVCIYFAGRCRGSRDLGAERTRQVEVLPDVDKICRMLHTAVMTIDRNLEEIRRGEQWSLDHPVPESGGQDDAAQWDLLAGLLEASYSGDGEYALDQLKNIRFYLHQKGIKPVEYSEETRSLFDVMPSQHTGTLRPALVQDGRVLKKGLAAGGR